MLTSGFDFLISINQFPASSTQTRIKPADETDRTSLQPIRVDYLICESWCCFVLLQRGFWMHSPVFPLQKKNHQIFMVHVCDVTSFCSWFLILPLACIYFCMIWRNVVLIPCNQFQVHLIISHVSLRCRFLFYFCLTHKFYLWKCMKFKNVSPPLQFVEVGTVTMLMSVSVRQ